MASKARSGRAFRRTERGAHQQHRNNALGGRNDSAGGSAAALPPPDAQQAWTAPPGHPQHRAPRWPPASEPPSYGQQTWTSPPAQNSTPQSPSGENNSPHAAGPAAGPDQSYGHYWNNGQWFAPSGNQTPSSAAWNWTTQNAAASSFANAWPQYQGPGFPPVGPVLAQMAQMTLRDQATSTYNANARFPPTGPGMGDNGRAPLQRAERPAQNKKGKGFRPLPVPKPTAQYMRKSEETPMPVFPPQRLLVVIDLNGTLLHRKNSKASFVRRRNVAPFLKHLLAHHSVMIWSSSKPDNVSKMVAQLFSAADREQLAAEWARDTLGLDAAQFAHKVQVYKQLSWVWRSGRVRPHPLAREAGGARWGQANTVLLDDSALKAAAEPFSLVELPDFAGGDEPVDVLGRVLAYIEWIRGFHDVSAAIRSRKFDAADARWNWEWERLESSGLSAST